MKHSLKNKAAIVGVGEAGPVIKGKIPGKSHRQLNAQAIKLAVEDAGLTMQDIDGIITPEERTDDYNLRSSILAEYLGMQPAFSLTQAWGGISCLAGVPYAAAAIATGLAKNVVVTCAGAGASMLGSAGMHRIGRTKGGSQPQYEAPYGPITVANYALFARRHMYEYGTTSQQLANIAVTFRKHAMLHPNAVMRTPITVEDVLNSRMIASPLHLLDCCLISDGGAAVVMTSAERARDLKQKPVYLLGAGESHPHMHISYAPSLTTCGAAYSSPKAYAMAGIERKDIDVLFIYDSFTITAIMQLEDLGFCKKGEAGAFAEGDRLSLGGELPTNTHGGLLSYNHSVRGGIFNHLVELVLQLRGQAEARQVQNARVSLIHGITGESSGHCTLIFGT